MKEGRGWLQVLLAGFAPGALLGAHLAGLIFFLNPGLPFAPLPVLRGIAFYAPLLGGVSLLLHLPFIAGWAGWGGRAGRARRARRWMPWALSMALAAAAALDGTHASLYAYFLPPGINDRLIRTAALLTLAALIFFYTALLHTLHRRRYGWRSRYGLTLLAAASIYAMVERREAFRPRSGPPPRPAAVEAVHRPRLLVVGLETATLDAILPLAGQGRLPFLNTVLQGGAYGRLESIAPPRRDALWITLASGKYPYKHSVTGGRIYSADWIAPGSEMRLHPAGMAFPQWGTLGRKPLNPRVYPRQASTLWEILPRLGVTAGVVGWPASGPILGPAAGPTGNIAFSLSDRYFSGEPEPGSIRPPDLGARAARLRIMPGQVDRAVRAHFGPQATGPVLDALARDLWRRAVLDMLATEDPQTGALFVELPGLEAVSTASFGGFDAFQFDGARDPASEAAAEQVAAYYQALDDVVSELWARSDGEPRVLAVVSAVGMAREGGKGPLAGLLGNWRREAQLGGSLEESPDGVLLLYGEGIRPGALLTGARLVDLAPTLLYALGFPVARDFDGKVITAAFDKTFLASHPLTFFPSYEPAALPK